MDSRERILTTLRGGIPDRIGRSDSIWSETVQRWRKEGLAENQDIGALLGFDFHGIGFCDTTLRFPTEVIEDNDEYIIQKDGNGVTRKDFKHESGHTPHWLEHTLKTGKDWYKYKDRLLFDNSRVPDVKPAFDDGRSKNKFVHLVGVEAYENAWPVFGQVNIFTMMMDEPEVAADVFMTYTDLLIQAAQRSLELGADYDGIWVYGDVGYRNGTLFSPECYDKLLFPAHKKMCDYFNSLNKPVILHSCGKIQSLIPRFIEAGFSAIQPLEAKCGQDVRELKQLYKGKITFFGNIDVRALSSTKEDIEEEIKSKLKIAGEGGGYIYHSDHSVPPTVSWDNYCYAMELLDKYGKY